MHYKRYYIEGGIYFITLVTCKRKHILTHPQNIGLLRESLRHVKKEHPFDIKAIVILPDHLHMLMSLPENEFDFSTRIRLIKSYFTRNCANQYKVQVNESRVNKKEQSIWQRRFWEHTIRDEEDFNSHADYIHYNPVHHKLVHSLKEWPYSSFQSFVEQGYYDADWGESGDIFFDDTIGQE